MAQDDYDVILYTDGACLGNPGPGGWAFILRHTKTERRKRRSGGAPATTNNRMELQAVIEGLRELKRRCRVLVVTDSQYVSKGMSEWLPQWVAHNWRRGKKKDSKPVKNVEFWKTLAALCEMHDVTFQHIRGHAGHPENEECDRMAVAESRRFH
jgi:ribonuclease HI